MSVEATGEGVKYQWYSNTTANNFGGTLISGATNAQFAVQPSGTTPRYFYVVVSDTCAQPQTSDVVTVTAFSPPVINTQPVSPGSYCGNSPATTLSVSATGAGTLTYQWYSNTTNSTTNATLIPNATSATYTTPAATNQTVYYFVTVTGQCSSTNSNIVEVGVGAENVWNGSTWSKTGNDPNMPGYTAVIRGAYNAAVRGNINACNITVDPSYTLTIGANSSATVQNAIVNNGELIVESDGNLKQINPSVVNSTSIKVKRAFTLTDARQEFIFLSSPVKGQNMFNIFGDTQGKIPYVLVYNEATDYFVNAKEADWAIPGRGFAIQEPAIPAINPTNSATATYTGIPNNGSQTVALPFKEQYYGFNVVGNPYPSNIDLLKLYAANEDNIDSDFKFWDKTVNNIYEQQGADYTQNAYAIYNAFSGAGLKAPGYSTTVGTKTPTNIVKVDQAFMIQASKVGQIVFNNDIRTVENTGEFFGKEVGRDIYYLEMTTPAGTGMQNAIAYMPEVGTTAFGKEDSEVLGYNASDALYSILDDVNVVINGRGAFRADDVIKLGTAHFNKGSHTIRAIDLQGIFATGQAIYLKDKVTNIITDISKKAYTFDAAEGESNNRFEIVYQSEALATDNVTKGGLVVYKEGNSFFVRGGKKMRTVEVYDATGRMVKTSPASSDNLEIVADSFTRGLYVLKVKYDDGTVQTKKVLK
ncbi:Ig-like domain-containing protein [Kaistella solincola]|uniref:Ig-like domain-containing protein n=1 Tax=Kaistella solincola TaxID=510955 RepID=UPI00146FCD81|nr:T9SS type A sorting domain-containing protein [Kaistella solincola]